MKVRRKYSGYLISPFVAQNWVLRLYAALEIDPHVSAVVHRIGPELMFNNTNVASYFLKVTCVFIPTHNSFWSRELLGMTYTDLHSSLIEMMHSMIRLGMVKKSRAYEKWMENEKKQMPVAAVELPQ